MPADIVPALQEDIATAFRSRMATDRRVRGVTNRIRDGTATLTDARVYAERAGEALSASLKGNLTPDILPNGRLYFNIADRTIRPALRTNYELVNDIAGQIQEIADAELGIGLNAATANFPENRITGLIDKMTEEGLTWERVLYWLGEPIVNNSEAFADDFVRENARFRQQAGLTAKVRRILAPGCCKWCEDVAGRGVYEYGDEPADFFRRHEYCRCSVTYETGRTRQNVWTKEIWEPPERTILRRRNIGMDARDARAVETQRSRDAAIRDYMRQTGYTRETARRATRRQTPAQIQADIDRAQRR